jgi:hypothetical protein
MAPSAMNAKVLASVAVSLVACAPHSLYDDSVHSGVTGVDAPSGSSGSWPIGQWVWNDVPDATCGNGTQTGFAVSAGAGSDVLMFLEGGGFCYAGALCERLHIASYFTSGYDGQTFTSIYGGSGAGPSTGIFDRTLQNNPFKDATLIYVPYCTGDLHTGSTTQWFPEYGMTAHYAGRQNLELYMHEIVPALAHASRVTLAGTSAGGFGSLINFDFIQQSFGQIPVDLITDSGPIFSRNGPTLPPGYPVWDSDNALPPDCTYCRTTNYAGLYQFLSTKYPASRFALLSHDQDFAISAGIYGEPYSPDFYLELGIFTTVTIAPLPNWRFFVSQGLDHGFLFDMVSMPQNVVVFPELQQTSTASELTCKNLSGLCVPQVKTQTTVLADWLTQMVAGDPSWSSTSDIVSP